MGYGHATVHRHLNGKTLPRGEFIPDFLTALDVNTDEVYSRLIALRNHVRELVDPSGRPTSLARRTTAGSCGPKPDSTPDVELSRGLRA